MGLSLKHENCGYCRLTRRFICSERLIATLQGYTVVLVDTTTLNGYIEQSVKTRGHGCCRSNFTFKVAAFAVMLSVRYIVYSCIEYRIDRRVGAIVVVHTSTGSCVPVYCRAHNEIFSTRFVGTAKGKSVAKDP